MVHETRVTQLQDIETGVVFSHTTYGDFTTDSHMVRLDKLANAFAYAAEARWLRSGADMIIQGSMSTDEKETCAAIFGFKRIHDSQGQEQIDIANLSGRLQLLDHRAMELQREVAPVLARS